MDEYTPTTAEVQIAAETSTLAESVLPDGQFERWLQGELARAWDEGALWRHHASAVHSRGLLWWQVGYPSQPVNAPNPYREGPQ